MNARRWAPARPIASTASIILATVLASPAARAADAGAQPKLASDAAAIGAVKLTADAPVKVLGVSRETAKGASGEVPFCLVKLQVPEAVNIWVGLPLEGRWNGRWQSVGGGGYVGTVAAPSAAVADGYAAATTDTGHTGSDGSFALKSKGVPNEPLRVDFAYRSEHLMAVLGKQLTQAFYGRPAERAYWNGCSTGGRQGLRMVQQFPEDYDGVLAGAPAIHMERFQAAQIWPQVVMRQLTGGPIAPEKLQLANKAAVAACDSQDGVSDGVLTDPRACKFSAKTLACKPGADPASCLTDAEATAIDRIWEGPKGHWYGITRGSALDMLAGPQPFPLSVAQPRYWVYLDPEWDWKQLTMENYAKFFEDSVKAVGPLLASGDTNLDRFRARGGKLILWHGWADGGILPESTVAYYEEVSKRAGGYEKTQSFARLFMAPGVGHCRGGDGPQPERMFEAVVDWVEHGKAPQTVPSAKALPGGGTRTRPLCPYPTVAVWSGSGSTDDAANFRCEAPKAAR